MDVKTGELGAFVEELKHDQFIGRQVSKKVMPILERALQPMLEKTDEYNRAIRGLSERDMTAVLQHLARHGKFHDIDLLWRKSIGEIDAIQEELRDVTLKLQKIAEIERRLWDGERVWGINSSDRKRLATRAGLDRDAEGLKELLQDLRMKQAEIAGNQGA